MAKGWFSLLRKFYACMGVNLTGFTCLNKIRDNVWMAYVNVKSWKFSTFYVNLAACFFLICHLWFSNGGFVARFKSVFFE